jgi:hypothetical protein
MYFGLFLFSALIRTGQMQAHCYPTAFLIIPATTKASIHLTLQFATDTSPCHCVTIISTSPTSWSLWLSKFCFGVGKRSQLLGDEFHWHNHNRYKFVLYKIIGNVNLFPDRPSHFHIYFNIVVDCTSVNSSGWSVTTNNFCLLKLIWRPGFGL